MKTFIRATGNISPQRTFGKGALLQDPVIQTGNQLRCTEPDYLKYIDAKFIRRMSRIIKMGTAAAMECLQESGTAAGFTNPDAIVMGTAYGCLDDTGIFLKKMVEQNEEMLTPTAFIQSTHNTIAAQIALLLQCHNYNNTFVHRGFSFESALLDAIMLLEENAAKTVLAGAADEITAYSHAILSRFGLYKRETDSNNLALYQFFSKGTIAGEGAAFFLLSNEHSEQDYATLDALHTFYKPAGIEEAEQQVKNFLLAQSISVEEIDLIILGNNNIEKEDAVYFALSNSLFKNTTCVNYKFLCGEYPTSTAFALWMAINIIKEGSVPAVLGKPTPPKIKRVLIYNHYQNIHHSLMLVGAC